MLVKLDHFPKMEMNNKNEPPPSVYLTLLKQCRSPPEASPSAKRRAKNHKSLQNSRVAKVLGLFRMETHVHILYNRIFGCKDSYFAVNITLNIFMYDYKD